MSDVAIPRPLRELLEFTYDGRTFISERCAVNGELRWVVRVSTGETWDFLAMPGTFDVPMSVRAWVLDWWSNRIGIANGDRCARE